jgi:DNA processing protein
MSSDAYWLALRRVHGVGPRTSRLLLENFGSAEKIFKASAEEVAAAGVSRKVADAIAAFEDFGPLEKELCELPRIGARLVRWTDADYPPNLKQIADPPPYLVVRGVLNPDESACVAVVGARAASEAGLRMAERLGFELASRGFSVVSGLARGIDGAAHRGTLDARGRTIAVLGCGIDVAYPPEHRGLADAIATSGGAVISELPLGTAPIPENFPGRNRILSGLSLGVVIVEAAEKSGSLITARMALEQDRQVFAVPGSPLSGKTRGSNRLIKEGAVLIDCVEDVIEELAPQMAGKALAPAAGARSGTPASPVGRGGIRRPGSIGAAATDRKDVGTLFKDVVSESSLNTAVQEKTKEIETILNCLSEAKSLHIDAVIESCQLPPQTVLNLMLELELRGLVVQHPGKLFTIP